MDVALRDFAYKWFGNIARVGWERACDLVMGLYEEFKISVSDDTVYRALKEQRGKS